MPTPPKQQVGFAQRMYTSRATNYEDSWHPAYSARLMRDVVRARPGERVLVLACGTGLESFIAARDVFLDDHGAGDDEQGRVVGVDVTEAMLAEARRRRLARDRVSSESARKQDVGGYYGDIIDFVHHDITDLDACPALRGMENTFDIIICSCAFVLLDDPAGVVRGWKKWLYKPPSPPTEINSSQRRPGRLVIDITHESNMVQGTVIESVARDLDIPFHSNRLWIKSRDSFRDILVGEGYVVDRLEFMDKVSGDPVSSYGADEADALFQHVTREGTSTGFIWQGREPDVMQRARELFREKWVARCVDGRVEVVDGLYVYVARPE